MARRLTTSPFPDGARLNLQRRRRASQSASQDHYKVLMLPRSAKPAEIKHSYIQLCKQFHPDVCSDPESLEAFRSVQASYEVLSDEGRKAAYDSQIGNASAASRTVKARYPACGSDLTAEDKAEVLKWKEQLVKKQTRLREMALTSEDFAEARSARHQQDWVRFKRFSGVASSGFRSYLLVAAMLLAAVSLKTMSSRLPNSKFQEDMEKRYREAQHRTSRERGEGRLRERDRRLAMGRNGTNLAKEQE